jgi:hypothetical protein
MPNWIWEKTYQITCRDGTKRTVHKNINDACPLFIPGWKADVAGGVQGVSDLKAEVKAKYGTQINGVLYSLNEQNQSLMMSFRTVYLAFSTNPCGNNDFFLREIEKLLDEQRKISALKIQIAGLIQLASTNPNDTAQLTKIFSDIASRLGGSAVVSAASLEIAETRELALLVLEGE